MMLKCTCNYDRCDKTLSVRGIYIFDPCKMTTGSGAIISLTWSDCHRERLDASISLDCEALVELRDYLNTLVQAHGDGERGAL